MRIQMAISALMLTTVAASFEPIHANPTEKPQCPIHHRVLQKDRVRIRYGLFQLPPEEVNAHQTIFPHSHKVEFGGCVQTTRVDASGRVIGKSPDFKGVMFCVDCRTAETLWRKDPAETTKRAQAESIARPPLMPKEQPGITVLRGSVALPPTATAKQTHDVTVIRGTDKSQIKVAPE